MTALSLPLVTVITPTYNRADYLRETLDSLLAQDYPNVEIIVIDDGSTDHTRALLDDYTGRIQWESQANAGEAAAVNAGFQRATGELIAVVNSDDPVRAGWLRAMVEFMQKNPMLLAAYPDWVRIDAESRPAAMPIQRDFDYTRMLRECICLVGPGAVFRHALPFDVVRDPQYRYVGDFDFWLRLGLYGDLARVPQTLATFRVHGDSASERGRGVRMANELAQMMEQLFARPFLPPTIRALRSESLSAAYYLAAAHALRESQSESRRYFIRSFRLSPLDYLRRPARLIYLLATLLLPPLLHRPLFRRWKQWSDR